MKNTFKEIEMETVIAWFVLTLIFIFIALPCIGYLVLEDPSYFEALKLGLLRMPILIFLITVSLVVMWAINTAILSGQTTWSINLLYSSVIG